MNNNYRNPAVSPTAIINLIYVPSPPEEASPLDTLGIEKFAHILAFLPNDIIQLLDPEFYASYFIIKGVKRGNYIFIHSLDSLKQTMSILSPAMVRCVFFVEENQEIYKFLKKELRELTYYFDCNIPAGEEEEEEKNIFKNEYDFACKIRTKIDEIYNKLDTQSKILINNIREEKARVCTDYKLYDFNPATLLCSGLNQFTGSHWISPVKPITLSLLERKNILIDNLRKNDAMYIYSQSVCPNKEFPTLVLIAPYFSPDYRQAFKGIDKKLSFALSFEQDFDYLYSFEITEDMNNSYITESMMMKSPFLIEQALTALFHSSLSWSPIFRLPEKSKSFDSVINKFQYGKLPSIKKLIRELRKLGDLITQEFFHSDLIDYLIDKNRQICCISDCPIELAVIDGVPISFLYDICRLPMTPTSRNMTIYTQNNYIQYVINKETYKNHLIITSSSDDNIINNGSTIDSVVDTKRIICSSVKEASEAIKKHSPHLLIFDCHGGYDAKNKSSYIEIGEEKLSKEDIFRYNISAPIVILSCCSTSPINCFNAISSAFLACGAFSVTSTLAPISIMNGGMVYGRVIKKLKYAVQNTFHKNWLDFICHIIRTALFYDYMRILMEKTKIKIDISSINLDDMTQVLENDYFRKQSEWGAKTMFFDKRKDCFKNIKKHILECFPDEEKKSAKKVIDNTPLPVEYLMYTHWGRPDLIYFESYLKNRGKEINENLRKLDKDSSSKQ